MAIEIGDILRVALKWLFNGTDEFVNVLTLAVQDTGSTGSDSAFLEALAAALESELYTQVEGALADQLIGTDMTCKNLTKDEVYAPVDNPIDGTASGADALAGQLAALVYLNGNEPRRQGRTYLPPFAENNLDDDGQWSSGLLGFLLAFAAALLEPLTDGDIAVQRVVTDKDGASYFVPSQAGVSVAPRTQRRRTQGRGG